LVRRLRKKPGREREIELPPAYVEDVKRLAHTLIRWHLAHPGARPDFRWPPKEVMMIGPLTVEAAELGHVCGNDDARRCVADLAEVHPEATLFMLRVACDFVPAREVAN